MSILPNMSIELPTLGADNGAWDDKLNAGLTLIDAHDHTSGKGPRVPTAGININADLAFGGFGPTGLGKAAFNAVTALAAGSKTLFVNAADNELYWRTNGGTNVKLTSGTTLNITLVGGIVGDYSSVGAEVAYDDANDLYTFKQQGSPKPWARIASGPVRIFEFNTTESVYVELAVAAALAASYSITLPAALPGATTSLLQITAAGLVSYSNTLASSFTAADLLHTSSQVMTLPAAAAFDRTATHTFGTGASGATNSIIIAASVNPIVWALPVKENDVINGWAIWVDKNTNGAANITGRIYKTNGTTGTETAMGAGNSNTANNPNFIVLVESALSLTVTDEEQYYLVFTPSGSVTGAADVVYHAAFSFTRP